MTIPTKVSQAILSVQSSSQAVKLDAFFQGERKTLVISNNGTLEGDTKRQKADNYKK